MPTPDFVLAMREHVGHALLPLVGVTAVVFDEQRRLLLHRRSDDGTWATPGGILEPGEQPAAGLVREVYEETGLRVLPERIVSVVTEEPFAYPNGDRVQFLDIAFRCRPIEGVARPADDESLEVRWFPLDGLPPMGAAILRRIGHAVQEGEAWFVPPPPSAA
ncbi:NUDIX hydrolase [Marinactinospora thermotolerans]|uniref:ADP-ribose pyrophosphatase YjhB, NUDIX family n=1 Tax=Marinactinospora thermotolerans DSM 45154 TaxID=1122192 RepID=A0A1T4N5C2_9ACTN|nr:NUDIX domain-containing protein [Marinactinospora thermotolerans]SJZ74296.1 ADP-ribose pyrophosphatase YjhB, NUDIX family [Marinactinospora thermotolerans DSM 45154]